MSQNIATSFCVIPFSILHCFKRLAKTSLTNFITYSCSWHNKYKELKYEIYQQLLVKKFLYKERKMIIDFKGVILTPGEEGKIV